MALSFTKFDLTDQASFMNSSLAQNREESENEVRFMEHETCCATHSVLHSGFWVVAAIFPHYFAAPGMREKEGEFVGGIDGGRARAPRFVVPSGPP